MAKIKYKDKSLTLEDGQEIKIACENLGIPFGCRNGVCCTCMIDIISGKENLSNLTREEKILERDVNHRLACQCKIKSGSVEIDFE